MMIKKIDENDELENLPANTKMCYFVQESLEYLLDNNRSISEKSFILRLMPYIKYPENVIEINGHPPTHLELGEKFGVSDHRIEQILKALKDAQVIKMFKQGRNKVIYMNPYVVLSGFNVSFDTYLMFKDSIFHTISINLDNKIATHNESKLATEIKLYCKRNYEKVITEYKIFRNPETNRYLPYDIYINDHTFFIEIHGPQHYSHTQYFQQNPKEFEYRQHLDLIKKEYAQNNGIYLEIDLRKIKKLEDAIKIIEDFIDKSRK